MTKPDSSMDPEVLGASLEQNRPERSRFLKRYVPRSLLIVGRGVRRYRGASRDPAGGWVAIDSCIGPNGANCPLLRGRGACTKRECADVAVVFVDAAHSVTGSLPLVRCAADPSSPAVVALEGQADAPVIDGDRAW